MSVHLAKAAVLRSFRPFRGFLCIIQSPFVPPVGNFSAGCQEENE